MRHDDDRRRGLGQERLDRLAGGDVEVVGRLVEQEQVGRQDAQQGELEARPLAARQQADLLERVVAAEQETGEVPARLAGGDRDHREDGVQDGRARDGGVAQLGQVGGLHVVAERDAALERRQVARDRPQQRRLARPVRPDDADPLAPAAARNGVLATVTGSLASEPSGRSAPRPGSSRPRGRRAGSRARPNGPGPPASALPGSREGLAGFGVSTRCSRSCSSLASCSCIFTYLRWLR